MDIFPLFYHFIRGLKAPSEFAGTLLWNIPVRLTTRASVLSSLRLNLVSIKSGEPQITPVVANPFETDYVELTQSGADPQAKSGCRICTDRPLAESTAPGRRPPSPNNLSSIRLRRLHRPESGSPGLRGQRPPSHSNSLCGRSDSDLIQPLLIISCSCSDNVAGESKIWTQDRKVLSTQAKENSNMRGCLDSNLLSPFLRGRGLR